MSSLMAWSWRRLVPLTMTLYFSFKKYLPLRGGDLGWVGFDISNGISPDPRYVRVATGRDYRDAAPVTGISFGGTEQVLTVDVAVEQQQRRGDDQEDRLAPVGLDLLPHGQLEKSTLGASRCSSSSTSKNSSFVKLNMPAMMLLGNISILLFRCRTWSL